MDYIFKDWKDTLEQLKGVIEKDLEEIRSSKLEMQRLRTEVLDRTERGQYFRDDHQIVISAPEIILGNVDKTGTLLDGASTVTIRANNVELNGVDSHGNGNGRIVSKATQIAHIAVDPGIDGGEEVVKPESAIIHQARCIQLQSNNGLAEGATDGYFPQSTPNKGTGIFLETEGKLELTATRQSDSLKTTIDTQTERLEAIKAQLSDEMEGWKTSMDDYFDQMESLLDEEAEQSEDLDKIRTNYDSLDEQKEKVQQLSLSAYRSMQGYIRCLSRLAETNRQLKSLKAQKEAVKEADEYKDNPTDTSVSILSEQINLRSIDGEGNVRTHEGAGVHIQTNVLDVQATDAEGLSLDESRIHLFAHEVQVETGKAAKKDDQIADFPGDGRFEVTAKEIVFQSLDRELEEENLKEKALTAESRISFRSETIDLQATDTEGKATGSISANAKTLEMKAMNLEKEKRTEDGLAEGSTLVLLAEKMWIGSQDQEEKNKSQLLQLDSDKVAVFAKTTAEVQQGEAEAIVQLDGGNFNASGSKAALYGDITLNGKTEVKDELKAPTLTGDSIQAKSQFKSPNISDGMGAGGGGGADKLDAKLTAEDAPKKE